MEDPFWVLLLIWGTWLLIAIVIDGLLVPFKLYYYNKARKKVNINVSWEDLPLVSIVVPVYNESKNIENCLTSIIRNLYNPQNLEIIVVDDGSRDDTIEIANKCYHNALKHGIKLTIIEKEHTGKVHTLNTGIKCARGDIIITIDADIVLEQKAIKSIVTPFVSNKSIGAASGYIEIMWDNANKNDFLEMFFSKCEFLEYLSSFNFERTYQSFIQSVYTMSGAFSAFRREMIGKFGEYWPMTVSEDMHVTMLLHNKKIAIINVPEAIAYVNAITDYDTLYSQRLRWARGQLEVASMFEDTFHGGCEKTSLYDVLSIMLYQKSIRIIIDYLKGIIRGKIGKFKQHNLKSFGFFGLQRILLVDHTIGFPRLLWVFVLLIFPLFGLYPYLLPLIIILMYLFYLFLDATIILFIFYHSNNISKHKIRESYHFITLLPLYKMMTYFFRMSAFLHILNEPPKWKVPGPLNGFKNGIYDFKNGVNNAKISSIHNLVNQFNLRNLKKKKGK